MKQLSIFVAAIFFLINWGFSQEHWVLDKSHSSVKFEVEHIVVFQKVLDSPEDYYTMGNTEGKFKEFSVKFTLGNDDFTNSQFEAKIDVNSVDTDNPGRDNHLKSQDFFDAEKYPAMIFKSKLFEKTGDKTYRLIGDLTIKGITKTIEMEAVCTCETADASVGDYISFTAVGKLNRFDYGLKWSELIEQGGFRVSNYVQLKIQANFVKGESSFTKEN